MRVSVLAGLLATLSLPVFAQSATSGTVFQVNARYALAGQTQVHTIAGTVTIDTTSGKVSAVNLSYDGLPQASVNDGGTVQYGTQVTPVTGITETWMAPSGRGGYSAVALVIPAASLTGFSGGALCSQATPCAGQPMSSFIVHENTYLLDGQIMPAGVATAATGSSTGATSQPGA